MSIIAIMASMVLVALWSAQETARVQKTRALIAKLDNIIRDRYESYRTRRAPIQLEDEPYEDVNMNGRYDLGIDKWTEVYANGVWDYTISTRAKIRQEVLRDLMRMEMPDRWSDVYDVPAAPLPPWPDNPIARPALNQAYYRKYTAIAGTTWPPMPNIFQNQNAECLYMIVMEAVAQEGDARDVFRPDSVADTDGDGFPEFVDAWGMPIRFLRWAPGFQSELQTLASEIPTDVTPSGQSVEIKFRGAKFATSAGAYLGGTLAVLDLTTHQIASNRMARITGYVHNGTEAVFTCETPMSAPVPFSPGAVPSTTETVVLMGPDPFDSRGVYPIYGNRLTAVPTFALFPLIYSAGPDRATGIVTDVDPDPDPMGIPRNPEFPLTYGDVALNPCFVPNNVGSLPYAEMMGTHPVNSNEPGFYVGCWNDNIHNHRLNTR